MQRKALRNVVQREARIIARGHLLCGGKPAAVVRDAQHEALALHARIDVDVPALDETMRHFVAQTVRALGIAKREWVADYFRLMKKPVEKAISELLVDGTLVEVIVESWPEPALMLKKSQLELIAGETSPQKKFLVRGLDVQELARRIELATLAS